jgi:hypothetical protein
MVFQKCLSLLIISQTIGTSFGLSVEQSSRRTALKWLASSATAAVFTVNPLDAVAAADERPDQFDVDNFIKSGMVMNPMGVSGQAGKSRPETGVVLRDGSEVSREPRSGEVLAEILLKPVSGSERIPVLASYASTWPLATGSVFDVECRDVKTGDGAFLAVSSDTGGSSIADLKDSFFVDNLIAPTGRFSFYGPPTDVKVKKSSVQGAFRIIDISFSTLSQSTQTEIPRRARVVATIPAGTKQAVMLVGSAGALRWKKGSEEDISKVVASFRAIPAPQTSMKVRAKPRRPNEL